MSIERDNAGRIVCTWCKQPMKILKNKDHRYAWCHGQIVVCSDEELAKLDEYWREREKENK